MKLKEFLNNISEMVKERPELLELDVVTSSDDEGNEFNEVSYTPEVGHYEDREFHGKDYYEDDEGEYEGDNAICVN